jgi:hypothetical protein
MRPVLPVGLFGTVPVSRLTVLILSLWLSASAAQAARQNGRAPTLCSVGSVGLQLPSNLVSHTALGNARKVKKPSSSQRLAGFPARTYGEWSHNTPPV